MTADIPTFGERFAEIFQVLGDAGWEPVWQPAAELRTFQPNAHENRRNGSYERSSKTKIIACAIGPIKIVELIVATEEVGKTSEDLIWQTNKLVSFLLRTDWSRHRISGFQRFSVKPDSYGHWVGNDLGLGIIEQLNEARRFAEEQPQVRSRKPSEITIGGLRRDPEITCRNQGRQRASSAGDLHAVTECQIELVQRCGSTQTYGETGPVPNPVWAIPKARAMQVFVSLAQIVAEVPIRPLPTEPPGVSAINAPFNSYLWWMGYLIFAALFLGGGVVSIFWDWPGRSTGWMVFLGIVLIAIGMIVAALGLGRWEEIGRGCQRLSGSLDRKWVDRINDDKELGNGSISESWEDHYIQVEGLPFIVNRSLHSKLRDGDSVIVTYWPDDKRIELVTREAERGG